MKVKPAKEGLLVRDPKSKKFLPAEGAEVNILDIYWHRRLVCGDVIEVTEQAKTAKKESKKEGA